MLPDLPKPARGGGGAEPRGQCLSAECRLRDHFPTACDLCRVPLPDTVRGQSLGPLFDGSRESLSAAAFAPFRDVQRMILADAWKSIVYLQARREQRVRLSDDSHELHKRSRDPDGREIAGELRRPLTEWPATARRPEPDNNAVKGAVRALIPDRSRSMMSPLWLCSRRGW